VLLLRVSALWSLLGAEGGMAVRVWLIAVDCASVAWTGTGGAVRNVKAAPGGAREIAVLFHLQQ